MTDDIIHLIRQTDEIKMKFSVLISIYYKEKADYFSQAMRSIWDDQTLKPDEIVLVKDGPLTQELDNAIEAFQHKVGNVLKIVSLKYNVGLGAALNEGLLHCSHELVARMDTDDIAMPERFEKQVAFMKNEPSIAVSSSWIEEFKESGQTVSFRKVPLKHKDIKKFARNRSPVSHPVTIFRKSAVLSVGGYPPLRIEDYALWSLLLVNEFKFGNLPDVLLKMRTNNDFLKRRGYDFLKAEIILMKEQIKMGLFSWPTFFKNVALRSIVRLSPNFLKFFLYKYARG